MSDFESMKLYKDYSVHYELFLKYKFNEGVEEALQFIFNENDCADIILFDNFKNIAIFFKLKTDTIKNTEKKNIIKIHEKYEFFRYIEKHGIFTCERDRGNNTYYACSICTEFWAERNWDDIDIAKHNRTRRHRSAVKKIIN